LTSGWRFLSSNQAQILRFTGKRRNIETVIRACSTVVVRGIRPDLYFKMFYTYILKSDEGSSYYVGSCKNLKNRLDLHNGGSVKSTKRYVPWRLAYQEVYENLKSARQREKQIKSWKKRSAIERLVKTF